MTRSTIKILRIAALLVASLAIFPPVRAQAPADFPTRPIKLYTLTTAGGLTVNGDGDRHLYVYDTSTGKVLFQTRLPAPLDGSAITYTARGRQYIAVGTRSAGRRRYSRTQGVCPGGRKRGA